jgi:hypothetical protein
MARLELRIPDEFQVEAMAAVGKPAALARIRSVIVSILDVKRRLLPLAPAGRG